MHHPTDRIIHTTAFVTPVVEHWLEQEIAQWEDRMISIPFFVPWFGSSFPLIDSGKRCASL